MLAGLGLRIGRALLLGFALMQLWELALSPVQQEIGAAEARDLLLALVPAPAATERSPVALVTVGPERRPASGGSGQVLADACVSRSAATGDGDGRLYARALDRLTVLGARLIVLARAIEEPGAGPEDEAALEDAVRRSGRVVLTQWLDASPLVARQVFRPADRLVGAALDVGYGSPQPDLDGMVRTAVLERSLDHRREPHVALVVAARLRVGGPAGPLRAADGRWIGPAPTALGMPVDGWSATLIDFPALAPIPRIDVEELLARPDAEVRALVADRTIVLTPGAPLGGYRFPYLASYPGGPLRYADVGWLLAAPVAATLDHRVLSECRPVVGWWLLAAVALLAAALWSVRAPRVIGIGVLVVAAAWIAATVLRTHGVLFDARTVTQTAGILALARLIDLSLVRWIRMNRLTAQLKHQVCRVALAPATRTTDPAPAGRMAVDPALLAELLPVRYTDLSLLGQGGMGLIYRARDARRGMEVALKLLPPQAQLGGRALERFVREMRLLQSLDHPGLVRILDVHLDALAFFTMEIVPGRSLDRRIEEESPIPALKSVLIAREIAEILAHVHARGIIHRDVKPSNVMVLEDGSIKLLDFGVARQDGAAGGTATCDVVGTAAYMAPEQWTSASSSPASDVYAVGVVLVELITGQVPPRDGVTHVAPHVALLEWGASKQLVELIERMLDPRPSARPRDGAALVSELDLAALTVDATWPS
jgi:hypothetical protein